MMSGHSGSHSGRIHRKRLPDFPHFEKHDFLVPLRSALGQEVVNQCRPDKYLNRAFCRTQVGSPLEWSVSRGQKMTMTAYAQKHA